MGNEEVVIKRTSDYMNACQCHTRRQFDLCVVEPMPGNASQDRAAAALRLDFG
jgi:hypothetical protein